MSASPAASNTGGEPSQTVDQIHFKFCRECSNLLYPKEDRVNNTLMFTCRTCHVGEPATSHCVFQNRLHSQVGDTAGVTTDVGADPTVGVPAFCTFCGEQMRCFICERTPLFPCTEDDELLGDDETEGDGGSDESEFYEESNEDTDQEESDLDENTRSI